MNSNKTRNRLAKLVLGIYDVFVVNASFFLALVVRFYMNGQFSELGIPYISAFFRYSPYYTICALIIFSLFQMYNMVWRVAGINDLKRILAANVCTFLVQVIGSRLFVRRMPTTYYVIGAMIQLFLICLIRFIPRLLFYECWQERKKDAIPAMIIGIGPDAAILQDKVRRDVTGKEKIVCLLDYSTKKDSKRLFNGVPIIYGIGNMAEAIKRYGIGRVFIADRSLTGTIRRDIASICSTNGVELKNFIIGMADDEETREWMKRYEEENGEEASFF